MTTAASTPADRLKGLQEQLEEKKLALQVKLAENALNLYDLAVDPRYEPLYNSDIYPPTVANGLLVHLDNQGRGEVTQVYRTWWELKQLRDLCRWVSVSNPFASNAIETHVSYITGSGMSVRVVPAADPEKRNDPLCQKVQDYLDLFCLTAGWQELEQETIRRCHRDGEAFLRWFPQPAAPPEVRVVEPEHVRAPSDSHDRQQSQVLGVETDPEDVQDVLGYWIVEEPAFKPMPRLVDAEEVTHFKVGSDRTAKRGLPTLFTCRRNLERADKLLRNMSMLAQVQATFAVIRKHQSASSAAVAGFAQGQADLTVTDPVLGRQIRMQQMQPGSIIDAPKTTDYEFPSSAVNAAAYVAILQAELRAVAAAFGMPEYLLTSDASNANYSSTMVAESPWVKRAGRWQSWFARELGDGRYRPGRHGGALWRAIEYGIQAGLLPCNVLRYCVLQVKGPSLIVRDQKQEAERNQILKAEGLLSPQTWSQQEGLDFDQEQANRKQLGLDQQPADPNAQTAGQAVMKMLGLGKGDKPPEEKAPAPTNS